MKINQPEIEVGVFNGVVNELESLRIVASDESIKHCIGCRRLCSCSNSPSCSCDCSMSCSNISTAMSSEPERYPIEEKVSKLTYAVNSLQHCQTCWSCEGHIGSDGEIEKWPSVWFYSSSSQIPKLLASHINSLYFNKKISSNWGIYIAAHSESIDTTYILGPNLDIGMAAELSLLQQDIEVIANTLHDGVKADAVRELAKIKRLEKQQQTEKVQYACGKV